MWYYYSCSPQSAVSSQQSVIGSLDCRLNFLFIAFRLIAKSPTRLFSSSLSALCSTYSYYLLLTLLFQSSTLPFFHLSIIPSFHSSIPHSGTIYVLYITEIIFTKQNGYETDRWQRFLFPGKIPDSQRLYSKNCWIEESQNSWYNPKNTWSKTYYSQSLRVILKGLFLPITWGF